MKKYHKKLITMIIEALSANVGIPLKSSEVAKEIARLEEEYVKYKLETHTQDPETFDPINQISKEVARYGFYFRNDEKIKNRLSENGIDLLPDNKWIMSDEIKINQTSIETEIENTISDKNIDEPAPTTPKQKEKYNQLEATLYAPFVDKIQQLQKVKAVRINELSSNNHGGGGNWLYPDIVGYKLNLNNPKLDPNLAKLAEKLTNKADLVSFYSYEVKYSIASVSEVRDAIFQTIANSSWANYAYLVVPETDIDRGIIDDEDVEKELELLSNLHGIGLIKIFYKYGKPYYCDTVIEATRSNVDWNSINKFYNKGNKQFIEFMKEINFSF